MPRVYKNPLVSILGTQPAETWYPNQGSCDPRCRVWGGGVTLETVEVCPQVQGLGIVRLSPHPRGSGSCAHGDHMSALYLQCVLSPQRFPASELRVLSWLTCGPLSSLHLVAFTWGQARWSGLLLCVSLSENLWRYHINIIAYHMLIHRVTTVWFPPRPSSGNLVCYWVVILYWSRVDFQCLFLGVHELNSVIHGCTYILFLFFFLT